MGLYIYPFSITLAIYIKLLIYPEESLFLDVLNALARAKNILWNFRCICLSHFSMGQATGMTRGSLLPNSATMTYVIWCEECLRNVKVFQRVYFLILFLTYGCVCSRFLDQWQTCSHFCLPRFKYSCHDDILTHSNQWCVGDQVSNPHRKAGRSTVSFVF